MRTSLALLLTLPLAALVACAPGATDDDDKDNDEESNTDGGDTDDDTDGGGGSSTAPLAELSSDDCPDMSESTTTTFTSSGDEREVTIVMPEDPDGPLSVVFFFHGLMDPASTPHPAEYMVDGLNMQSVADSTNTIVIAPVSKTIEMFGFSFFMWDASREGDEDLVLYDDLRTCVADQHDVDLDRLSVMGFSGGALWTTVILGERGDTIASAVSASGGADVQIPLFENLFSEWTEPASKVPVLLQAGGETDVWPDASLAIVDFSAATDTLQQYLVDADHYTVRCDHDSGHTITQSGYSASIDWLTSHTYGEPSPYQESGIGSWDSWCYEAD
jgi:predicted esterase